MPFRIVRNDITKMQTEAVVNTANDKPTVGTGCDHAIYEAAGYEELLAYRQEHIGYVAEGEAFITPGFNLPAKYIIHAVSPRYIDGEHGEEELLRSCYRKSLRLAEENGIRSIAFPLISTGGFGYPKEEGMRIAVDEIHAFLLTSRMEIYLVVFDEKATSMGKNLYPDLEAYIDHNYVQERRAEEYGTDYYMRNEWRAPAAGNARVPEPLPSAKKKKPGILPSAVGAIKEAAKQAFHEKKSEADILEEEAASRPCLAPMDMPDAEDAAIEEMESRLKDRLKHLSDTFQEYLFYLIRQKGLENADVYKRAIVDKKVFSKIKTNPYYHPQKRTALCLCVGAMLNIDETKDLLARAGYALSPCDKTDVIFSYFIENGIYDMIELDIQLEEHGLPYLIS